MNFNTTISRYEIEQLVETLTYIEDSKPCVIRNRYIKISISKSQNILNRLLCSINSPIESERKAFDKVVELNRELLLNRSDFGIVKYSVTLDNSGLTDVESLQHALEEALDLANYLQAAKQLALKLKDDLK